MPGAKYSPEQHQLAFETFADTRNLAAVCRKIGVSYPQAHSWSKKDYNCYWGCPYHGWDELIEERNRVATAVIGGSATLNRDLTQGEFAKIANSSSNLKRNDKRELITRLVRSDFERITHWELLYAKIFFDLFGIVIEVPGIDINKLIDQVEDKKALVKGGLHFTNPDVAMKAMIMVQEQIKKLQGDIAPINDVEDEDMEPEVSLDELNRVRLQIKSLPAPDKSIDINARAEESRVS